MPHQIWKGAISFGLVHAPIRLYPATKADHVDFSLLDKRTIDPVGYKKINKRTGKEVQQADITRGFEYEKGKYVLVSDEEIRAANPEATQTIDIVSFCLASEISPDYFDTPYFLAPDKGGDKVYTLLRDALQKSEKVGIALVVMHRKQHLAALIPEDDSLRLITLRWNNELRETEDLKLPAKNTKPIASAKELEMALRLIEEMTEPWKPERFHDTFRDDILKLVKRKVKAGKTEILEPLEPPKGEEDSPSNVLDLSELLRKSLGGKMPPKVGKQTRPGNQTRPKNQTRNAG